MIDNLCCRGVVSLTDNLCCRGVISVTDNLCCRGVISLTDNLCCRGVVPRRSQPIVSEIGASRKGTHTSQSTRHLPQKHCPCVEAQWEPRGSAQGVQASASQHQLHLQASRAKNTTGLSLCAQMLVCWPSRSPSYQAYLADYSRLALEQKYIHWLYRYWIYSTIPASAVVLSQQDLPKIAMPQ